MLKTLINLANQLDSRGLIVEATVLDRIIKMAVPIGDIYYPSEEGTSELKKIEPELRTIFEAVAPEINIIKIPERLSIKPSDPDVERVIYYLEVPYGTLTPLPKRIKKDSLITFISMLFAYKEDVKDLKSMERMGFALSPKKKEELDQFKKSEEEIASKIDRISQFIIERLQSVKDNTITIVWGLFGEGYIPKAIDDIYKATEVSGGWAMHDFLHVLEYFSEETAKKVQSVNLDILRGLKDKQKYIEFISKSLNTPNLNVEKDLEPNLAYLILSNPDNLISFISNQEREDSFDIDGVISKIQEIQKQIQSKIMELKGKVIFIP